MVHLLPPGAQYNRVPSQWRLAGSPWLHPSARGQTARRLPRFSAPAGKLHLAWRLGLGIHFIDRKVLAFDPARSRCLTLALELFQILWGKR